MLRADALKLGLGVLLIVVGLAAAAAHLRAGRGAVSALPWFGLFSFLYGLRLLARTDTFPLFFSTSPLSWRYVAAAITYVILVPALLLLRAVFPAWRRHFGWAAAFVGAFAVAAVLSDAVLRRPASAEVPNNLIAIAFLLVGIGPRLPAAGGGRPRPAHAADRPRQLRGHGHRGQPARPARPVLAAGGRGAARLDRPHRVPGHDRRPPRLQGRAAPARPGQGAQRRPPHPGLDPPARDAEGRRPVRGRALRAHDRGRGRLLRLPRGRREAAGRARGRRVRPRRARGPDRVDGQGRDRGPEGARPIARPPSSRA